MVKIRVLAAIQFPQRLAALIAGNSDDGIRICAAIPSAATFLKGSFFQNRLRRQPAASLGRVTPAAFVFF
jgi:hypothetical protein